MKRKLLAVATLAAISSPVSAMRLDIGGDDWDVRWDNTIKGNLMSRVAKQDKDVIDPARNGVGAFLADDSDLSVDRTGLGIVSTRLDVLTEFDAIYKRDYGFRVSAAGWYDPMYGGKSDHPRDKLNTWGSPSVDPGEYNDAVKEWHYLGGEILDAFVFANFTVGDMYTNVRLGRHTIYWGNSLLGTGAVNGIAGSMTTIDFNKALAVPGSEAKELFLPANKLSTSIQLTYDLTLSAFYGFEHREYRLPEAGSYFGIAEGFDEDSEFITLAADGINSPVPGFRAGYEVDDDETENGDWGINLQYYVEPLLLETTFVYMNYVGKTPEGFVGGTFRQDINPDDRTIAIGDAKWLYKDDIDLFGVAFAKEIAGISVGLDILTRRDAPLPPGLGAALTAFNGDPLGFEAADSSNYAGPVGDTYHVVLNGIGLLTDNGIWEGGSWLVEGTFSSLDECTENCDLASPNLQEGRIVSHIGAVFRPTWFQVFPGTDLSVPIAFGYGIDGDQAPIAFGGAEESGSASIGLDFDIRQIVQFTARYNAFFGPVPNGVGNHLKDRDNVSFTVKYTF